MSTKVDTLSQEADTPPHWSNTVLKNRFESCLDHIMIDLVALHSMMNDKGFHYFDGGSNDKGELSIYFSTHFNGRGDSVSIEFDATGSCNIVIFKDLVEVVNKTTEYNTLFYVIKEYL